MLGCKFFGGMFLFFGWFVVVFFNKNMNAITESKRMGLIFIRNRNIFRSGYTSLHTGRKEFKAQPPFSTRSHPGERAWCTPATSISIFPMTATVSTSLRLTWPVCIFLGEVTVHVFYLFFY